MRIAHGMPLPLLPFLLLAAFAPATGQIPEKPDPIGNTTAARFAPPPGATRVSAAPGSFAAFLRQLPLMPDGASVHLFNGELKGRQDIHAAVIGISVGSKDLQQCADAVMRLRAEHLYAQRRYDEIHFNFTNGFRADFSRWANGQRIEGEGAHGTRWRPGGRPDSSYASLLSYLDKVFTYAGTASLSKELVNCADKPVEPGDVFIRGGHPGHAMIVVDVAAFPDGRRAFLLAQSYMPAQEIHVVKNPGHPELGAWFIQDGDDRLYTPEWTFNWEDRRQWPCPLRKDPPVRGVAR